MEKKKTYLEKLWVTEAFLQQAKAFFQTDDDAEAIEKLLEWFNYYQSIIPFKGRGKGKGFEHAAYR